MPEDDVVSGWPASYGRLD